MLGVAAAPWTRWRSNVFLTLFMLVSMTPFVWTAVSNPTERVHYGALLPFLLVYVMTLANVACVRMAGRHA